MFCASLRRQAGKVSVADQADEAPTREFGTEAVKRLMKELDMDGTVDIVYAGGVKATEDFRGTVDNERFFRQPSVGPAAEIKALTCAVKEVHPH